MARTRPKDIGTAAETAVVRAARTRGFPLADRLTLTGRLDRGDVGLCPGLIIEVKGGTTAKTASDTLIATWLDDTEHERINAGAAHAFLVTQRAGVGPTNAHRWWAWWRLGDLPATLIHPDEPDGPRAARIPIRMTLDDALYLLRTRGWGTPLNQDTDTDSAADVRDGLRAQEVAR